MDCLRWLTRSLSHKTTAQQRTISKKKRRTPQLELLETRDVPTLLSPAHLIASATNSFTPLATTGPTGYSPTQIRHAYGFDQISLPGGVAADGSGTTIAIVDAYDCPTITSDLHNFDVQFGLADPTFAKVNQSGGSTMPAADTGWSQEIALDVEWAHAIAPKAGILLVEAADSSDTNLFSAVQYAASQPGVVALSMSWGGSEFYGETSYDSVFTTPSGHAGVAFVASSGDSGAPVSYPGISPNVLTVGGTTLNLDSQGNYLGESGWSGSGGGVSTYESQPSYQKGVVTQTSVYRTNPDVSYDANPSTGFPVYITYGNSTSTPWLQFGGTSDAAPQWAALIAIADQGRALAGEAALNGSTTQLLPMIYKLAASDFHDVAGGTSTGSPNYSAGSGYDLVTGRGSPYANLVVSGLIGTSTLTPTTATHFSISAPTSAVAGTSFNVTVTALDASNHVVTNYTGTIHFTSTDSAAVLPANYTFTSSDAGARTFTVTLRTAGTQAVTATDLSSSSLTGSASVSVSATTTSNPTLIEGFETGSSYYLVGSSSPTFYVISAATHDGTGGLEIVNNNDWIYRNDAAAQVKQGDSISTWIQLSGSANGRAYFGFGASASGTLSVVLAPNSGQFMLQDNVGYNYAQLSAAGQGYRANHWYRVQINWGASGNITAQLYDSNGTTLLNSVSAYDTNIVSGGIAFRGIGSNKYFDTVTDTRGVVTSAHSAAAVDLQVFGAPRPAGTSAGGAATTHTPTASFAVASQETIDRSLSTAAIDRLFAASQRIGAQVSTGLWQGPWGLEFCF
jgi:subtilase family serine protease